MTAPALARRSALRRQVCAYDAADLIYDDELPELAVSPEPEHEM